MTQSSASGFHINAAWEPDEESGARCRWFVIWQDVGEKQVVGAVAGYAGGGAYSVETFWGELEADQFTTLWMDFTDRVSEEEINFSSLDATILARCEAASDVIWQWNDYDVWCDRDAVRMSRDKDTKGLSIERGMLRLGSDHFPAICDLCEYAGLTAGPAAP